MTHLRFALAEDLTDQRLERLCQRRIRGCPLVLIELAGREEAARRNNQPCAARSPGGCASGKPVQHEFWWYTWARNPVKRPEDQIEPSSLPPVNSFFCITLGLNESCSPQKANGSSDPATPFRQQPPQVSSSLEAVLVRLLGIFSSIFINDRRQIHRLGDANDHQVLSVGVQFAVYPLLLIVRRQTAERSRR